MSTSVKHIHNGMRGAPQINGNTPGCLIAVLDALFISGWGVTTAVSVTVSGGIATATLTSGHNFDVHSVILVDGATPSALNGESRVTATSLTSTSWATTAPDGAATGTITIRYAPQTSWSKVYAATNKAVYRSTHPQARGRFFRIDDTGTDNARIRGFEEIFDVDSGIGPFPLDTQLQAGENGGFLWKSLSANATPIKYHVICDELFVVILLAPGLPQHYSYLSAPARGFGDVIPLSPAGDAWATVISCAGSTSSNGYANQGALDSQAPSGPYGGVFAARPASGLGSSTMMDTRPFVGTPGNVSGDDLWLGTGPSAITGALHTSQVFLREKSGAENAPPRAIVPGVLYIPQDLPTGTLQDGQLLDGSGSMAGRKLLIKTTSGSWAGTPNGFAAYDLSGPWR